MEWINCNDKLPDDDGPVLIVCKIIPHIVLIGELCDGAWYDPYDQDSRYGEVTHWMPLPEVPNVKLTGCATTEGVPKK